MLSVTTQQRRAVHELEKLIAEENLQRVEESQDQENRNADDMDRVREAA